LLFEVQNLYSIVFISLRRTGSFDVERFAAGDTISFRINSNSFISVFLTYVRGAKIKKIIEVHHSLFLFRKRKDVFSHSILP